MSWRKVTITISCELCSKVYHSGNAFIKHLQVFHQGLENSEVLRLTNIAYQLAWKKMIK
jgi:hypothetical protein